MTKAILNNYHKKIQNNSSKQNNSTVQIIRQQHKVLSSLKLELLKGGRKEMAISTFLPMQILLSSFIEAKLFQKQQGTAYLLQVEDGQEDTQVCFIQNIKVKKNLIKKTF